MIRIACLAAVFAAVSTVAFAQDAVHGQKVFTDQKCSICHSVAGVGNKKGPLDEVGSKFTAAEIRQWIVAAPEMMAKPKEARRSAMKAYAALPKEDLYALIAYLLTLKK